MTPQSRSAAGVSRFTQLSGCEQSPSPRRDADPRAAVPSPPAGRHDSAAPAARRDRAFAAEPSRARSARRGPPCCGRRNGAARRRSPRRVPLLWPRAAPHAPRSIPEDFHKASSPRETPVAPRRAVTARAAPRALRGHAPVGWLRVSRGKASACPKPPQFRRSYHDAPIVCAREVVKQSLCAEALPRGAMSPSGPSPQSHPAALVGYVGNSPKPNVSVGITKDRHPHHVGRDCLTRIYRTDARFTSISRP